MKNDNKGFSLIELIVVIAIMAILVGVMAPNVLKYVESSRESADKQAADAVRTAVMTALVDPGIADGSYPGAVSGKNINASPFTESTATDFSEIFADNLGKTPSTIGDSLRSKKFKGADVLVTISSTNEVSVLLKGTATVDSKKWQYDTSTGEVKAQ